MKMMKLYKSILIIAWCIHCPFLANYHYDPPLMHLATVGEFKKSTSPATLPSSSCFFTIEPAKERRADSVRARHVARVQEQQRRSIQVSDDLYAKRVCIEKEDVRGAYIAQQYASARTFFEQQCAQASAQIAQWRTSHPMRFAAYEKAVTEGGKTSTHCYQLSPTTRAAFKGYTITCDSYYQLHGNALQHQLLQEAIVGVEQLSALGCPSASSFNALLYEHAFMTFDDARFANEMGDCMNSAQLIDVAVRMKECIAAALFGVAAGACDGAQSAVMGAYTMVRHPVHAAYAFKDLALDIAAIVHDYVPLEILDEDASPADWELYASRCEETAHKWRVAADQLKQHWEETPAPELVYQLSYGVGNVSTNVLVSNACFGMMSKAARWARYEATKAAQYASQITLSAVPGFLRFDYAADALSLEKVGRKLGFSQGQIERALGRLDLEAECCSQRFKQAAQELHNVPGASKKIEEVFNGNLKVGNVKGAAFELESALQQLERGEEIVAIGYKHGDKEFDVMTKTKLIECKHWHWDAKNAEDISELEKALKQRQAVARQLHKKLVVHSKKPVPSRLRKWLQKNKIDLLEG